VPAGLETWVAPGPDAALRLALPARLGLPVALFALPVPLLLPVLRAWLLVALSGRGPLKA